MLPGCRSRKPGGCLLGLFGGLHPAGIVPASFFFGLLIVGADMTQRMAGVPANMVLVLQGVIILVIVATRMVLDNPYLMERAWRKYRILTRNDKEA